MSRALPESPNLEHLKKQAKALLQELQQRDPALQLADALHSLAREYGFASWPKLKAHVLAVTHAADHGEQTSPFAGYWTANISRSTLHPANPFRSATLHFDVSGSIVTITDVMVDASGKKERGQHTIQVDGQPHASASGNGYVMTASWHGTHVLEAIGTKDGEVVGRGRYEVSADGTRLTITADEQVIVCDRQ